MINRVLQEVKKSQAPFSVTALSEKLGIDRSALEGMLAFWVRKGRLQEDGQQSTANGKGSECCSCGLACSGAGNCAFMARMPKIYSVASNGKDKFEEKGGMIGNI